MERLILEDIFQRQWVTVKPTYLASVTSSATKLLEVHEYPDSGYYDVRAKQRENKRWLCAKFVVSARPYEEERDT